MLALPKNRIMSVDLKHEQGKNQKRTMRSKDQVIAKVLVFNSRNLNYKLKSPDPPVQKIPEPVAKDLHDTKKDTKSVPFSFQNVMNLVHPEVIPNSKTNVTLPEKTNSVSKESPKVADFNQGSITQNHFDNKSSGVISNILSNLEYVERPSLNLYKPGNQSRASLHQTPRISLEYQKQIGLEPVTSINKQPKNSIKIATERSQENNIVPSMALPNKAGPVLVNPVTINTRISNQTPKLSLAAEEILSPGFTQINVPLKNLLESKGSLADKKFESIKPILTSPANQMALDHPPVDFLSKESLVDFPGNTNKITFADATLTDDIYMGSEKFIPIQQPIKVFGAELKIVHQQENLSMKSHESHRNNDEHHYVTFQKPKPVQRQASSKSPKSKNKVSTNANSNTMVKAMAVPQRQTSPNQLQNTKGNSTKHLVKTNNPNAKQQLTLTARIPDSKEKMNEMINERFPLIEMRYRPLRRSLSLPRFSSPLIEKNPSFYIGKVRKLEEPLQTGRFIPKSHKQKGNQDIRQEVNKIRPRFTNPFKDD